jgi:hypothetical protein
MGTISILKKWCIARLKVVVERMLEELTKDVNMGRYVSLLLSLLGAASILFSSKSNFEICNCMLRIWICSCSLQLPKFPSHQIIGLICKGGIGIGCRDCYQ